MTAKADAAGRSMTLGRRVLLFLRDERLATVKEIAQAGGVSTSTVKALIAGTLARPSLDAACDWQATYGIPIHFWRTPVESQDPDLANLQSRLRR